VSNGEVQRPRATVPDDCKKPQNTFNNENDDSRRGPDDDNDDEDNWIRKKGFGGGKK
jgi:hypothetical protein